MVIENKITKLKIKQKFKCTEGFVVSGSNGAQ
jgi:hypothetical protein